MSRVSVPVRADLRLLPVFVLAIAACRTTGGGATSGDSSVTLSVVGRWSHADGINEVEIRADGSFDYGAHGGSQRAISQLRAVGDMVQDEATGETLRLIWSQVTRVSTAMLIERRAPSGSASTLSYVCAQSVDADSVRYSIINLPPGANAYNSSREYMLRRVPGDGRAAKRIRIEPSSNGGCMIAATDPPRLVFLWPTSADWPCSALSDFVGAALRQTDSAALVIRVESRDWWKRRIGAGSLEVSEAVKSIEEGMAEIRSRYPGVPVAVLLEESNAALLGHFARLGVRAAVLLNPTPYLFPPPPESTIRVAIYYDVGFSALEANALEVADKLQRLGFDRPVVETITEPPIEDKIETRYRLALDGMLRLLGPTQ